MIGLSEIGSRTFQSFPDLNHLFGNMFSIGTVWLSIMCAVVAAFMGELAIRCWDILSNLKPEWSPLGDNDHS